MYGICVVCGESVDTVCMDDDCPEGIAIMQAAYIGGLLKLAEGGKYGQGCEAEGEDGYR